MSFGFDAETLSPSQLEELASRRAAAAADCVRLVSLSQSGHPGGSLSTLDGLMMVYACGNFDASQPQMPSRDRVVVSHGHVSPAVYSTLGSFGFFDMQDAYDGFRKAGTVFGGHIENVVPGVEWNTGNLGQGLSAGAGFAMAARVNGDDYRTFVFMGDGEQQKGQVSEGRRFASKFGLSNLIALVDVNRLQIGGKTDDIMPFDLAADWAGDGWNVVTVDGHDHAALYAALRTATEAAKTPGQPTVLLLETVMGKGYGNIENDHKYHGQALPDDWAIEAIEGFGQENNLEALRAHRKANTPHLSHEPPVNRDVVLDTGTPKTYEAGFVTDCRSAYGNALKDLADLNKDNPEAWPVVGISCDLEGSVKMNGFHASTPDRFIEAGIMEHHAAVLAGAMSKERTVPFFSTFGMFAMVESYNQQRLNDQNSAGPKVVSTHCGLDVGEDGPTHQCIDYVAVMRNLFGFEVFVPADANECDRIIRNVGGRYGAAAVAMGRSKLPTIGTRDGKPALAGEFVPGRWPELRPGEDAVVFAFGPMVYRAVEASDALFEEGIGLKVVNASSLAPFDRQSILDNAMTIGKVLTYEDHNVNTGLGCIVTSVLGEEGVAAKVKKLGVSRYGTSGKPVDLFAEQGLAPSDLIAATKALIG